MTRTTGALGGIILALFGTACLSSSGDDCSTGAEDCACTAGGGCDPGLECVEQKCIAEPDTDRDPDTVSSRDDSGGDGDGDDGSDQDSAGAAVDGGAASVGGNDGTAGDGDDAPQPDPDMDSVMTDPMTMAPMEDMPTTTPVEQPPGEVEGAPCDTVADCDEGLVCVANIFTVGVCARGCAMPTDCEVQEECVSYTASANDAHCVNLVEQEYELCGVADTSVCTDLRECLYFPGLPLGVCVTLCQLAAPTECGEGQTCLDILANAGGTGVCGTVVARGGDCGLDIGLYCEEGDLCRRTTSDLNEAPRCYQDCTTTGTCDSGTCQRLDIDTRVCL